MKPGFIGEAGEGLGGCKKTGIVDLFLKQFGKSKISSYLLPCLVRQARNLWSEVLCYRSCMQKQEVSLRLCQIRQRFLAVQRCLFQASDHEAEEVFMGGACRQRNRLIEGGGAIPTGFECIEKGRKIDGPSFCHVGQYESLVL